MKEDIIKLLEKMEKAAYERGKADGINALVRAAKAESPSVSQGDYPLLNGHSNGHVKMKVRRGAMTSDIVAYIKESPNQKASTIINYIAEENPKSNPKSIRNTMDRLRSKGILENDHGKWRVL